MGILDFLKTHQAPSSPRENSSIRKIVEKIDHMPPDQAKRIAAFAYLLGRIAYSDLNISREETEKMEEIVRGIAGMDADTAVLIVQIAKSQNVLFGGTENYLVAREFRRMTEREDREKLLHCLFAVAGSDDEITGVEDNEIRQISKELGFSPQEYIQIRLYYRDKLSVFKR